MLHRHTPITKELEKVDNVFRHHSCRWLLRGKALVSGPPTCALLIDWLVVVLIAVFDTKTLGQILLVCECWA